MDKLLRLLPQSPVASLRADTPIRECVRQLRERAIGAIIITSDDIHEEIVGIFTERDLVKNMELITNGNFWESAVRTVMSSPVKTITMEQIHEAPRIMAHHRVRHLPIVREELGKKYVVGVISMRDLFKLVLSQCNYDLRNFLQLLSKKQEHVAEMVGVFSSDAHLIELVEKGTKLSPYVLMRSMPWNRGFDHLTDVLSQFRAILIDLDGLTEVQRNKLLAQSRMLPKGNTLFYVFTPLRLSPESAQALHKLADHEQVHLLAKPVALGLLYEKFLKLL
jgi:CBS domain-containing protein